MPGERRMHVAVCGGGLVGALNACYLAKRGFKVDLYEMRQDIRTMEVVRGRSINLALSFRGREALKRIGMEEHVVEKGIPMHARMIHNRSGERSPIPYGKGDQHILSVDRRLLNEVLLSQAEKHDSVTLHFSHKLISCNLENGEIVFQNDKGDTVTSQFDLIIGTDGAYSTIRKHMMKSRLFDYQQEYIPHGYMELNIPPNPQNEYAMETNYLHIWPRNEFMMIALPNLDKSFTTTLFMPFPMYDAIKTEDQVIAFFQEMFPDSIPLLGEEALKETFLSSKGLPMVSIKCHPYHVKDKALIMGDAAHAMVPFYGQGMNAGFEDCIVLDEMLDRYNNDLSVALPEYTKMRSVDAKAICDLAMYNYVEMRSSVNSKMFLLRKKLDNFLLWLMPGTWIPLYTMVSFTRIRYHECIARRAWQDKIVSRAVPVTMMLGGVIMVAAAHAVHKGKFDITMPEFLGNAFSRIERSVNRLWV